MRIRSNWISLISWRGLSSASSGVDGSLRKLSSGLRVGTAADDVAGLAISNRILVQYRGLIQANRNALDGISLINTAEGALQEINAMLSRGRELALQASNGTVTKEGRESIQVEVRDILTEIDRISDTTTYNGRKLFSQETASTFATIYMGLKTSWLEQASAIIEQYLGLRGDGATLKVAIESSGPGATWITGTPGVDGVWDSITLHVDASQFTPQSSIAGDRKVAAALSLATMARNTNYVGLPDWFKVGVAELIAGRDEQVKADIGTNGVAALLDMVDDLALGWSDDSLHKSAAYLLVKYMNWRFGSQDGIRNIMDFLQLSNGGNDLDTSVQAVLGRNLPTLFSEFSTPGVLSGATFLSTLNLTDPDVGSVNPGDNLSVIPDDDTYHENPLTPEFDVELSTNDVMKPVEFVLQVGANVNDRITITIPHLSTLGLGLLSVDVINRAQTATDLFTQATNKVSTIRAQLGSVINRLETTVRANDTAAEHQLGSYSRIKDLDFAKELTEYTRQQILVSSSVAMLAQATSIRQNVKWLLNGLSMPKAGGAAFMAGPV